MGFASASVNSLRKLAKWGVLILATLGLSEATTLYNVTFSSPEHTVGAEPATGGPTAPSRITFGRPTVEASLGVLTDQPLVMRDSGPPDIYDQIEFTLGQGLRRYLISFDLLVHDSSGGLTVLLDTPIVQNLSFDSDQIIRTFQPTITGSISHDLGSYAKDTVLKVLIDVDLLRPQWTISIDNAVLLSGLFYSASGDVESIRFSHGRFESASTGLIGIDNILITDGVPEPVPWVTMAIGLGIIALVCRFGVKWRGCARC